MDRQLSFSFARPRKQRLLNLIDENPEVFEYTTNTEWFKGWLKDNMHIYNEFERYAVYLKEHGNRDTYGSKGILERIRWDTMLKESSSKEYKISNNSTPYLARLVMLANPELEGMFRTKTIGSPEDDTL